MQQLFIVDDPDSWPLTIPDVQVVSARAYLTDPEMSRLKNARAFNLCNSYKYQSLGYYVSLLAEARGHRPQPDILTTQDLRSPSLIRLAGDDLEELVESTLKTLKSDEFTMSIYFGQTLAKRDRKLGARLFAQFRSPLLRAQFKRSVGNSGTGGKWTLTRVRPIPASQIPAEHHDEVVRMARDYFTKRPVTGPSTIPPRYYLAVLVDEHEKYPPSDAEALKKLQKAAQRARVGLDFIGRDDAARLGSFDALFIRTTTAVNHYTYRFARRAAAEGLAVIDDPLSITRCTNKVYLAERLAAGGVAIPQTLVLHRENLDRVGPELGFPAVIKQPDSAFSQGVARVNDEAELHAKAGELLEQSELVVAQRFLPTDFDWRVGVLDGRPLYVCRYFMAKGHWQIIHHNVTGPAANGKADTLPIDMVPRKVIDTAVKAANLIGDGLYGVDLKQSGNEVYVIEVNDNPNIDGGIEDQVLGERLYDALIQWFTDAVERIREGTRRGEASNRSGQDSGGYRRGFADAGH